MGGKQFNNAAKPYLKDTSIKPIKGRGEMFGPSLLEHIVELYIMYPQGKHSVRIITLLLHTP